MVKKNNKNKSVKNKNVKNKNVKNISVKNKSVKNKSVKNKSIKNNIANNKIGSKKECNSLDAWHMPWNSKKYKRRCKDTGCIWENSLLGSYCKDKKTITDNRIEYKGLNDPIYLASLEIFELIAFLANCNMADQNYMNIIVNKYLKKRSLAIRDIVINPVTNLLIKTDDTLIYKIISNAKKDKLKNIKSFEDLKYRKIIMQENCFHRKLGTNPFNYTDKTLFRVQSDLNSCGIKPGEQFYNIAMYNYNNFSRYNQQ